MAQDPYNYLNTVSAGSQTQPPNMGGYQIGTSTDKIGASQYPGMQSPYAMNGGNNPNAGLDQYSTGMGMGGGAQYNQPPSMGGYQIGTGGNKSMSPSQYPGGDQYNMYSTMQNRGGGTTNRENPVGGVDLGMRDPQNPQQDYNWGGASTVNNPYGQYQNMFDPAQWANETQATQYQRYLDNTLPLAQLQQNQYQYSQDYNEAQRRWNMELQRQQGLDQYQQGLSDRQFNLADWQAQTANSQWQDQFNQTKANDLFSQGLARDQFGLQQGQQQWNQNIQQQQQNNANRQTEIEAQYKAGLIDAQTAQNEIAKMNYQNQFSLGQQQNSNTLLNYQNQYQLGLTNADIQRQLNQGNLTLGQGRLTLDQTLGQGNLQLNQQRLLQEAQQGAENRQMQERIAAINATGRAQAPTTKFISNF